jgi:hypothetical protein
MEEAQVQEPVVEQAPAQEAVTEAPVQEAPTQEPTIQEAPVEVAPAQEQKAPFEIFDSPEALAASMQRDFAEQEETTAVEPEAFTEPQTTEPFDDRRFQPEPQVGRYSQQDVDGAVISYLSEKLGRPIQSFEELSQPQLDEGLQVISKFMQDTGRSAQDWFRYQSLNPSEMDDITAVRVHMASEHPNLNGEELGLLIKSKYAPGADATDDQKRMAQLQLKMDATSARESIDRMRSNYVAPKPTEAPQQAEAEPLIDQNWVREMAYNLDAMEGIEFDLGNDKTFTFGMDQEYKKQLAYKNANLENFFDPYVREDGSWDFDMLSSHRTVIDNIDKIVQSAYRQGMSDGQRGVVQNAANVQAKAPDDVSGTQNTNPLGEQVRDILRGNRSTMTFNI